MSTKRARGAVVKTSVIGGPEKYGGGSGLAPDHGRDRIAYGLHGEHTPSLDPHFMWQLYKSSPYIRPCVDSYKANCESHGWKATPTIDPDGAGADATIAQEIYFERLRLIADGHPKTWAGEDWPTAPEVEERKAFLRREIPREQAMLERYLSFAVAGDPSTLTFDALRCKSREDYEVFGNSAWEVQRHGGRPLLYCHAPWYYLRIRPEHPEVVEVPKRVRIGAFGWTTVMVRRRFRTFVQVAADGSARFFREFGDPRPWGNDGRLYESESKFPKHVQAATEMRWRSIYDAADVYGRPRWEGAMLPAAGGRESDELNYARFTNNGIPRGMLLLKNVANEDKLKKNLVAYLRASRGSKDHFGMMTANLAPRPNSPKEALPDISFLSFGQQREQDGEFLAYDARVEDKVGFQFRLPRILRGNSLDQNRASADAALEFIDPQVFRPERAAFDAEMNSLILPELDLRFVRFESLGPRTSNPKDLGKLLVELVESGILLPAEAAWFMPDVVGRDVPRREEPWAQKPLRLTIAELRDQQASPEAKAAEVAAVRGALETRDLETWKRGDTAPVEDVDPADAQRMFGW